MSVCDDRAVRAALDRLRDGWTCRPAPGGWAVVATGVVLGDGDLVELWVRREALGAVAVSDRGALAARLDLAGVDASTPPAVDFVADVAAGYGVAVGADGSLGAAGADGDVPGLLWRVATAVAVADAARYLPPRPSRDQGFADEVRHLLGSLVPDASRVRPRAKVPGRSGTWSRVTAEVARPGRVPAAVQAVRTGGRDHGMGGAQRALWVFGDLAPGWEAVTVFDAPPPEHVAGRLGEVGAVVDVGRPEELRRLLAPAGDA